MFNASNKMVMFGFCKEEGEIEYGRPLEDESKKNILAFFYGVHLAHNSECAKRTWDLQYFKKKISWEIKEV